jgi:hypothetical protein
LFVFVFTFIIGLVQNDLEKEAFMLPLGFHCWFLPVEHRCSSFLLPREPLKLHMHGTTTCLDSGPVPGKMACHPPSGPPLIIHVVDHLKVRVHDRKIGRVVHRSFCAELLSLRPWMKKIFF